VVENFLYSFSQHGQFIKDFLDDCFAGFFLGLGFVGDGHAVAQLFPAAENSPKIII